MTPTIGSKEFFPGIGEIKFEGIESRNPLAFRYYGAEEAGRVGFSIAVWTAIISLANIWTVSVLPKINFLVATKNWQILDRIVWRRFIAGEITLIFAGIMFFIVYLIHSEQMLL